MARKVSILIPTHNRCGILARALESLSSIHVPPGVEAELIVVANACSDQTEAVVAAAAPGMPMPTRCVVEPKAGLNVARNCAAEEATGDILAYLDDDVWVDRDWLNGLVAVYESQPAGVVGGRVLLWWEAVEPPDWMCKEFETMLGGSDHGDQVFELTAASGRVGMLGANFSFTRETWIEVGRFLPGLDRTGGSLLGGGETEFLWRARAKGIRFFYAPLASVKHWVAPQRTGARYLHRLAFDYGRTAVFMSPERPFWSLCAEVWMGIVRAFVSALGVLPARLSNNRARTLSRRLGVVQSLGRSAGAVQRLCGRSPVQKGA
jgi:glucosyl-dolichyl phosphate glucuronosyltransferase